jgi:hypothetical protein
MVSPDLSTREDLRRLLSKLREDQPLQKAA